MDKKSEILKFLESSLSSIFSGIRGCDELKQLVNILVAIIFRVMVKSFFQGSYCTISKCSFSLTHCGVNLQSFSFAKFFELSSKFCSLFDRTFVVGTVCDHSKKCTNRFLAIFCFLSFCIYGFFKKVLTNR